MQLHDVQGTQMHCFFHLVNGEHSILDEIGVTVSDLEAAKAEALTAINELRRENDGDLAEDWKGWALQVVCTDGRVLCSIDLNGAAPT